MEQYLNTGIKELISKFPAAGDVLNRFNIGCVPCNVGTCLLKDIVNIHDLTAEQEQELFWSLGKIFTPGKPVILPEIKRKEKPAGNSPSFSPPVKMLMDEHVLIKRLIALIPEMVTRLDIGKEADKKDVLDSVDFIRNYADRFHHAKEEDILFKYFDENMDILKVMHEDHTSGRNHVKKALEALDAGDGKTVTDHLSAYALLLSGHIKKEDEVLYPWMERNLTTREIGEMYGKFGNVDREFAGSQEKYEALINALEKKYN